MLRAPSLLAAAVLLTGATGCGLLFNPFHTPTVIEGAVTTRETPPPLEGTRVHVVLTPADSNRVVIAETTLTAPARLPFTYALNYDPRLIRQRQTYVVRASLTQGEEVLLATNAPVPVITVGSGRSADLVLSPPPQRVNVDTTRAAIASEPRASSIAGTVVYAEQQPLPFGAVVTLELLDLARADEPAIVATSVVRTRGEQIPIAFSLTYPPDRIAPRDRYAIRARVLIGERVLYRTRTPVPVLTFGAPTDRVEVIVEPVPVEGAALPRRTQGRP